MPYSVAALRTFGFTGFIPFTTWSKADVIPKGQPDVGGVYAVLREATVTPTFTDDLRPASRRRARSAVEAAERWVEGSQVLYFGKAPLRGPSKSGRRTGLAQRLNEYHRHGFASGANHHGGKLIWQLGDADDLLVAWKILAEGESDTIESGLILGHIQTMGRAPYANTGAPRKYVAPIYL